MESKDRTKIGKCTLTNKKRIWAGHHCMAWASLLTVDVDVSKNRWFYPKSSIFNRVFHYKPSILGTPILGNIHVWNQRCLFERYSPGNSHPFTKTLLSRWFSFSQGGIWMFPKIAIPQNGWFISRKTLLKWMIWGYHYFWKHPYVGSLGGYVLYSHYLCPILTCHPFGAVDFRRAISSNTWRITPLSK